MIKCQEVSVSFHRSHLQTLRTTVNEVPGAKYIGVQEHSGGLGIGHYMENGELLKLSIYNYAEIKEHTLERILRDKKETT